MNALPSTARSVQGAEIWWINPWKLGLFFLVPIYLLVCAAPLVFGPEIATVRFRFYFDAQFLLFGLAFLLILIARAALFVQLDIGPGGMYPACYLSLLEILPILYFWHQRAFPVSRAILLGYLFFSSRKGRRCSAERLVSI